MNRFLAFAALFAVALAGKEDGDGNRRQASSADRTVQPTMAGTTSPPAAVGPVTQVRTTKEAAPTAPPRRRISDQGKPNTVHTEQNKEAWHT